MTGIVLKNVGIVVLGEAVIVGPEVGDGLDRGGVSQGRLKATPMMSWICAGELSLRLSDELSHIRGMRRPWPLGDGRRTLQTQRAALSTWAEIALAGVRPRLPWARAVAPRSR